MTDDLRISTLLAPVLADTNGSVTPPIVQTSLFSFDSYQSFEDRMSGRTGNAIYTRVQNPTVAAFEGLMAKAEQGEAAVAFASGIAAIFSTLLAHVKPGDKIACVEHVHPDTYSLMERLLRPFGVETSYHSAAKFEDTPNLLKCVKIAYLESPSSVIFAPLNLSKVAEHAKRHGALTMIDNSWASPVCQRPLTQGIDIVVHSASNIFRAIRTR